MIIREFTGAIFKLRRAALTSGLIALELTMLDNYTASNSVNCPAMGIYIGICDSLTTVGKSAIDESIFALGLNESNAVPALIAAFNREENSINGCAFGVYSTVDEEPEKAPK